MNDLNRQQRVLNAYIKLMRCSEAVTAGRHRHLVAAKLTLSQFAVLEALLHLGPLCMREISRKLLKTGGNLTMVVNNLEKRGLVKRQVNADDRRFVTVMLTGAGKDKIQAVFPHHADEAAAIFTALDAQELDHLGRLLKKLGTAAEIRNAQQH
jgi:MarR family 2-MHQ and catechol resistance regulon transcriptional repressor